MKNQYVGDIGDYGKYSLLRALTNDYSIGVNWYLTPSDGKTDGRHINYLQDNSNDCLDCELFYSLKKLLIAEKGEIIEENRTIKSIENINILPNVSFYNDELAFENINPNKRMACRELWVNRSFSVLGRQDIFFLDPDNGFEVQSTSPISNSGNKYVTYCEARRYYLKANIGVVVYNHRDRSKENDYIDRFSQFYEMNETKDAFVYRLTFIKTSVRDYIFIIKPDHSKAINDFLHNYVSSERAKFFELRIQPKRR